jgi:uncharacterized protein YcbK (DUF882 family)
MTWNRRRLLRAGGLLAGMAATALLRPVRAQTVAPAAPPRPGKHLALANVHTGETLDLEFFRAGAYVPDALSALQVLLRDFRNGEQHVMDPKLMDYLYDVALRIGVDPVFSVISGYRSPQTNEQLREHSNGVARHSLHLEGRAIDVRLAGVNCAELAAQAQGMTRGGVGYYRNSDFVHLDTGAYRTWNG